MITVSFNNEPFDVEESTSIGRFLSIVNADSANIAVAVNNKVIPKSKWNDTTLGNGDHILIIKAFYGG